MLVAEVEPWLWPLLSCSLIKVCRAWSPTCGSGITRVCKNLIYVGGDILICLRLFLLLKPSYTSGYSMIAVMIQEAIPSKDGGGKVIVIDTLVENNNDNNIPNYFNSQICWM